MKKGATWAGIIGAVSIIWALVSEALAIGSPSDFIRVTVAMSVANFLLAIFGILLVTTYFRSKRLEEKVHSTPIIETGTVEDMERLRKIRSLIFGFILAFSFMGHVEFWILNNYKADITPINVLAIFSLVMGLISLYFIVRLFKNKKNLTLFLCVVIFYGLGIIIIGLWRHDWVEIIGEILITFYFVYAILAPINRNNFRIAQFMVLPVAILVMIVLAVYASASINQLWNNELTLEQQLDSATSNLDSAYSDYYSSVNSLNTTELQNAISLRDTRNQALISITEKLQAVYGQQIPSGTQLVQLEKIKDILVYCGLLTQKDNTVEALISYDANVDMSNLTSKQRADIDALVKTIDNYNQQINDAVLKV